MDAHYFLAPVEVLDHDKIHLIAPQALISKRGIYRLFGDNQEAHRAFLEQRILTVRMDGVLLHGALTREQGDDGVFYNLQLLESSSESITVIEQRLQRSGFVSPWKREYPRIPISPLADGNFELPQSVVFPRAVGQNVGMISNFSFHGLLFTFQTTGLSVGEFVGKKIQFMIVTNRGNVLRDMEARVTRIYDTILAPGKVSRGLGVKFLHLPKETAQLYQGLILEACTNIQQKEN